MSAFCPASALQLHPHATIIVDEAAASRLRHKDYYKYAFEHKPAWQASDQRPDGHIDMRSRTGAHDGWVPRLGDPSSHGAVIIAPESHTKR